MQFKTKLGLVDIPNADVLNAARDIMLDGTARCEELSAMRERVRRTHKAYMMAQGICEEIADEEARRVAAT